VYEFIDPIVLSDYNVPSFNVKYLILLELGTKKYMGKPLYKAIAIRNVGQYKHTFENFNIDILNTYKGYRYNMYKDAASIPEHIVDTIKEDFIMENNMLDVLASGIWEDLISENDILTILSDSKVDSL